MMDRTPSPQRRAKLALLHVAKKQLALTDESYRDILRRVTGLESASAMSEAQLDACLDEFKRLGFKAKPKKPSGTGSPQHAMIYAIWGDLGRLGVGASKEALRAFVKRQTGRDDVRFLDAEQATKVVEGLKAWRARLQGALKRTTPGDGGEAA